MVVMKKCSFPFLLKLFYRLTKAVLTNTHNLCFNKAKIRNRCLVSMFEAFMVVCSNLLLLGGVAQAETSCKGTAVHQSVYGTAMESYCSIPQR